MVAILSKDLSTYTVVLQWVCYNTWERGERGEGEEREREGRERGEREERERGRRGRERGGRGKREGDKRDTMAVIGLALLTSPVEVYPLC